MQKREKILLILAVLILAYYIFFEFMMGSPDIQPGMSPVTGSPQAQENFPVMTQASQPAAAASSQPVQRQVIREPVSTVRLQWQNDPFKRDIIQVVQDSVVEVDRLEGLRYTGYGYANGKLFITINYTYYSIGESVNGLVIKEANDKYVLLEENGVRYRLPFSR